jgi:hypothetical protein
MGESAGGVWGGPKEVSMGASEENAGRDPAERRPRLIPDGLVDRLVPEPGQHEPMVCLTGFLGRGTAEGVWRLYLTRGLDEYVEFAESDVVHTEPVPEGGAPGEGTTIWLRVGTTIRHTRVSSRQVQAEFLQGRLTSRFMPRSGPLALRIAASETGAGCTHNYVCSTNPHIPACQVDTEGCGGSFGCDPSLGCPPVSWVPCG